MADRFQPKRLIGLLRNPQPGVAEHLAAVWRDNPGAPADEPPSAPTTTAVEGSSGPRALRPGDPPYAPLGRLNERLVSRTDPDAGLVARDKVPPGLYYKVHVGVDGGAARVLTAVEVTSGEVGDEQLLGRLIREHVGSTGRTVTEVVADTKYGTQANYLALEAAQIKASIPPFLGGGVRRALGREHFVYDPATDRYRCPAGQPLRRMGRTRTGTPLGGFQARRSSPSKPPMLAGSVLPRPWPDPVRPAWPAWSPWPPWLPCRPWSCGGPCVVMVGAPVLGRLF
jgi:hypothetical protein